MLWLIIKIILTIIMVIGGCLGISFLLSEFYLKFIDKLISKGFHHTMPKEEKKKE